MRKTLLVLYLIGFTLSAFSQGNNTYWIKFKNKTGTPYSLQNPKAFLSERSIQRRQKQGIPLDSTDLPVNPAYLDSLESKGAQIIHASKWLNGATITLTDTNFLNQILALPFVQKTQQTSRKGGNQKTIKKDQEEFWLNPQSKTVIPDSQYYGASWNQVSMMNVNFLHQAGYKGQGKWLALFDSGFPGVDTKLPFQHVFTENKLRYHFDYVAGNNNTFNNDSHGTMTFSCIAARQQGVMVGTATEANYLLFRTENANSEYVIEEDNWVVAAEKADSCGADVFSTSLGYTDFDLPSTSHTQADMDGKTARISIASRMAASKGILVVSSAGNQGNNSWRIISAPSDADSVLSIGAVNAERFRAGFSSQGLTADGRIKPTVMAQGAGSAVVNPSGTISFASGTSFSGPILAGSALSLWSAFPAKKWSDIYSAIIRSADRFQQPDSLYGYGIPDFKKAYALLGGDTSLIDQQIFELIAFPNPFNGKLRFQISSGIHEGGKLYIFDLAGKLVESATLQLVAGTSQILEFENTDSWKPGVYFARFEGESDTKTLKIIKY